MIIYHGITTWHILECWIHKLVKHKDEEAILILPDFILEKFPNIEESFPKKIFEIKIIPYMKLNYGLEKERFEAELKNIVDSMNIGDIAAADEIYVAGGQYMFSHYLITHNVPFHFFEEAPGRLTTAEIVMGNVRKINQKQYDIAMDDGMFEGNSTMVKTIICNISAQVEGVELPTNVENLDVIDELHNISKEELDNIKEYFNVPDIRFCKNSAMILTQHFANLGMLTYVEQALLYQMTADYFLDRDKLFVKPHPDDLMSYSSELKNCEVISGCFPSELLHIISDTKVDCLLAISSSSILNLKKYYGSIIGFNEEYLKTFYKNHQYYLAAKIVEIMGNNKTIRGYGINLIQFNNMLDVVFDNKQHGLCVGECGRADISIIDSDADISELAEHVDNKSIYIFLNPQLWYEFAGTKQNCLQNSICKPIGLSAMYEEYVEGVFYLYIYCENKTVRKEIADMHYVKKLLNTGIETTVPKNDDKDIEIAVLKGILRATESRLQYYIEKEKINK